MGTVDGGGPTPAHADTSLAAHYGPRVSALLIGHVAYSTSEALAFFAVLAAERRLTFIWVLWAIGALASLTGLDRRAAAQVTPRLDDAVVPVAARVGAMLLLIVPFDPGRSTSDLAGLGVTVVLTLLVARGLVGGAVRGAYRRDWLRHPTLIVGSGEIAARLIRAMLQHPECGMRPTGLVDDDAGVASSIVPRLGCLDELEAVVKRERVTRIVLAFWSTPEALVVGLLRACERLSVEIYVVPRLFELGFDARLHDELWGIPLTLVPRSLSRRSARVVKRGFDVVISMAALILLSPVMAVVAAVIRLSGPGPVIFRQYRIGLDARPFTMLKFRTLLPNHDGDRTWSVAHDPTVGKLGGFLRRTGLDELPQLVDVLRGDMSLVGPRPERGRFADIFTESIAEYAGRHRVRPGITGWAQVHGLRGDTSVADRARFDNYYLATWTLSGDVLILLRTAFLCLRQVIPGRILAGPETSQRPAPTSIAALSTESIVEQPPPMPRPGTTASGTVTPQSAP